MAAHERVQIITLCLLGTVVGAAVGGVMCGVFLSAETWAANTFRASGWLLWLLPVVGVGVVGAYRTVGSPSAGGNRLLIAQLRHGGIRVLWVMAPLIAVSTVVTHLVGGPVGREGAAVQMGGGLCGGLATSLRLPKTVRRAWLLAGMSAGFAGVFGTPLAAAVFTLEVVGYGQLPSWGLGVCLVSGFVGDVACRWAAGWLTGAHHTVYAVALGEGLRDWRLWVVVAGIGLCGGCVARGFVALLAGLRRGFGRWMPRWWLRAAVAGFAVILLSMVVGRDYLGLGVSSPDVNQITVASAFTPSCAVLTRGEWYAFAVKGVLTAIVIAAGYRGGEVTPLFFMGATFGCAAWGVLQRVGVVGLGVGELAGAGMVAVFSGASRAPLACGLMGWELFGGGPGGLVLWMLPCVMARLTCGRHGIYSE